MQLRLGLSHLHEHRFKHDYQNCVNPICSSGLDIEYTSHFLLYCPIFNDERYILTILNKIDWKLLKLTNYSLSKILFYCNTLLDKEKNTFLTQLLNIFYPLKDSKRLLFKFSLMSWNPSRKFPRCFIIFPPLLFS